jgi:AraC-like DNA-binding protein
MSGRDSILVASATQALERYGISSLDGIASCVGVHRHTVASAIRRTQGLTFRQWRAMLLARRAAEAFRCQPNLSIKEIAAALGFSTPQSFCRFVKRTTGMVPSDLRRQIQSDELSQSAIAARGRRLS